MSITLANLQTEIKRVPRLLKPTTSLSLGILGWDSDPNLVDPTNSEGEYLLYNIASGSFYLTTLGSLWCKLLDTPGGLWFKLTLV